MTRNRDGSTAPDHQAMLHRLGNIMMNREINKQAPSFLRLPRYYHTTSANLPGLWIHGIYETAAFRITHCNP